MKSAKEPKIADDEALKEVVIKVAGKNAAVIVSMLKNKSDVDEFKMAHKANMTINELRNMLYKLHHGDLVSFIRKKDKKKGWFIYYWTLDKEKAINLLKKYYKDDLEKLEDILDNIMKKNYFICPRGHTELSQESALEQNFECMECGELLVLKDRETEKKRINRLMEKIKVKIKGLEEIIEKYEAAKPKFIPEVKKKKVKKKAMPGKKGKKIKEKKPYKRFMREKKRKMKKLLKKIRKSKKVRHLKSKKKAKRSKRR